MAAMMLMATVAVPTAARQVLFKGAFSGQDTASHGASATESLDTAATGTGTHLGEFVIHPGSYGKPREPHSHRVGSVGSPPTETRSINDSCLIG